MYFIISITITTIVITFFIMKILYLLQLLFCIDFFLLSSFSLFLNNLFFFVSHMVKGEENPEQLAARANRLSLSAKGTFLICDIDVDNAGKYHDL